MRRFSFQKYGVLLTAIMTGIWGIAVSLWAYPGLYDRLFIYEQTRNHEQVAILLEQLLSRDDFSSRRLEEIANLYLEAGQLQKVEKFIQDRRLSPAYMEPVMDGYRRLGDLPNLLRLLLLKQEKFPRDLKLREEIIQIYQKQGEYAAAIQQLREGVQLIPEHLEFYEQLGQAYFQIGNDEQALEIYKRQALQINDADNWSKLAETYLWKGYLKMGEGALLRALELDPSPQRMVRLATFYTFQKNTKEAHSYYLRAADALEKLSRENWETVDQLLALEVYDALGQTETVFSLLSNISLQQIPQEKLSFYFYIALRAQAQDAIDTIFQSLMANPAENFLRVQFDYALFRQDAEAMLAVLKKLAVRKEVSPEDWQRLASLYVDQKQPERLIDLLKQGYLPLSYWMIAGNLYFAMDRTVAGLQAYRQRALALNQIDTWKELVQLYFFKKHYAEGLKIYRRQLAESYNQPELWKELADFYFWQKMDAQGEEALLQAVELSPRLEWVRQLAQYYERTQQFNQAETRYQQIIGLQQQAKTGYLALARFYVRHQQLEKAVPIMQQLQEKRELSIQEQIEALQLYIWASQNSMALQALSAIPIQQLPVAQFATYLDLAIAEKDVSRAGIILNYWKTLPSFSPVTFEKLITLYFQTGEDAQALATYEEYAGMVNTPQVWAKLAGAHAWKGNLPQANIYYRQASKMLEQRSQKNWSEEEQLLALRIYDALGESEKVFLIFNDANLSLIPQQDLALYFYAALRAKAQDGVRILFSNIMQNPGANSLQIQLDYASFHKDLDMLRQVLEKLETRGQASKAQWEQLASLYLEQGQLQPVEQLLHQNRFSSSLIWMEQLASHYEHKKQLQQAERYYQQAIPLYENDKTGWLALTRFYIRNGKLKEAVPLTRELQEQNALSVAEQIEALNLYIWTSKTSFAIQTLSAIPIEKLPHEQLSVYFDLAVFGGHLPKAQEIMNRWRIRPPPDFLKKEMDFAILQGDTRNAVTLLKEEIQQKGESIELLGELYELYESDHDNLNTIETVERIVLIDPNNQEWLNKAINYYTFHQEFERASAFFAKLFATNPAPHIRKPLIWSLIEQQKGKQAQNLLETTPTEQWDLAFEQLAIDAGYLTQDYQYLSKYLQARYKREKETEDLMALIDIFEVLQDIKQELFYVRQLVFQAPSFNNQVHYTDVLFRAGEHQTANTQLDKLVKSAKTFQDLWAVVNLAEYRESPLLAFNLYERLLQIDPSHSPTLKQYGTLLAQHGQFQKAVDVLERYLASSPDDTEMLLLLAEIYLQLPASQQKQKFFRNVVTRFQDRKELSPKEKRLVALGFLHTKQPEKAIQTYRGLVHQLPQNPEIVAQFISLLYQSKQYESILLELQKYPVLQKTETYYQFKSSAQGILNQREAAISTLNEWVQQFPENEQAWIDLGYMYQAIGDRDQAFEAFEQARQLPKQKRTP